MENKIVVLGGGTAGWFSALFAKKFISNNVTLIESVDLGIVGVGEGTVPSIMDFLKSIDIEPYDVIKHTGGSFKLGISFERWNNDSDDDKYFHNFIDYLNDFRVKDIFSHDAKDFYIKELISKGLDLKDYQWQSILAYKNKVDDDLGRNALHFDTFALGKYLSTKATERKITHVDGKFKNVQLNDLGFIKKINLEDGRSFDCDFVFDCTGFSKQILGKQLNEKFISYSDTLAMKKALVISKPEPSFFPYTKAIAMKNGWTFEIPLQHRTGRGYIFDSDYIDENKAHEEVEQFYKQDVEVQKVISFDAGRMQNAWVNNCVAIGLAQSFVEPLEATSIYVTTEMLTHLKHHLNSFTNHNPESVKAYNKTVGKMVDNVRDFIRFHYISKRDDTLFWKEYSKKYKLPDYVNELVCSMKKGHLDFTQVKQTLGSFNLNSWMIVGNGLNLFTSFNNDCYKNLQPTVENMKEYMDEREKSVPTMKDWIDDYHNR